MNIEEADVTAALRESAPFIGHVHLSDSNRLLPGQGHIDWKAVFTTLREIGYQGALAIECRIPGDPADVLPQTLAFLKEMAGGEPTASAYNA